MFGLDLATGLGCKPCNGGERSVEKGAVDRGEPESADCRWCMRGGERGHGAGTS